MEEQLQQIAQVALMAAQGDKQAQQQLMQFAQQAGPEQVMQIAQALAQSGDQQSTQAAQVLAQVAQSMSGQAPSMRNGGAVTYLKYLKGECPEGYEMQIFKKGGAVCKQCIKKKQKMQEGASMSPIEEYKCGRKMKKKASCGTKMLKMNKCGGKQKK